MSNLINLLAIDTSTDACSASLCLRGIYTERFESANKAHTRLLLPMIESLLKEAGISLSDLDAFAFGRGPGSFTGLRIAAGVIQGLSFALNKPVIPVSTLRALAQAAFRKQGATQVFSHLDARLQEIYWGLFKVGSDGIMQAVSEERVEAASKVVLPAGEWVSYTEFPSALDIAVIAQVEYALGHTVPAELALPVYLRDNVVKKPG